MAFLSDSPASFQDELLPENSGLIGWAALVHGLGLDAPVREPACVSSGHISGSQRHEGPWRLFDKRYNPGEDPIAHIVFALRNETFDLLILKRAFDALGPKPLEAYIASAPTGVFARRLWFFYEEFTGQKLDIPDAASIAAVDALDPGDYITLDRPHLSQRHRVRDNLLGSKGFCPIVRRTEALQGFIARDLAHAAQETVGQTGAHLISRAASFMLLADSQASFAIEGERPPRNRLERWANAIKEAGKRPLNQTEIYRLHRILLGDDRFTSVGYRTDGVFLGERDHNQDPLPEFIGARPDDLPGLMLAWNTCNNRLRLTDVDAVIQAAVIAFGFVYIHPLEDGNGRLHRCLIHHVLAERKFAPAGMVFPVSSVMLDRIDEYRATLQAHSAPLMPFIDWRATPERNVEVLNDTGDLYRYFDATEAAEFLYACVQRTIETDLPREIAYLRAHDDAERNIMNRIEMPDRLAKDFIMFVRQNNGHLSKARRTGAFASLADAEVAELEEIVQAAFADYSAAAYD
ncbi:MAG: Fic family protein [Hyphomonas sp.]|uniref:Fic family protein n=1 Tax=Hyphomonas sp. TaxID=87 RepID=UPI003001C88D